MARSNRISALIAAPFCVAALLAPALAQEGAAGANAPAASAKARHAVKPKPTPKPEPTEAAAAPAAVAPEPEPQSAFGHQMPRQSLINRLTSPEAPTAPASASGGPGGKPAAPVEAEDETLPNGMPKKFLLNRLFDSSALEEKKPAAQPDPRSFVAQAQSPDEKPAPLSSWWNSATSAIGLGDKPETPAGNLPPVNVTAPGKPDRRPGNSTLAPPPAPPSAPASSPPGWLDRATGALGLGGDDETVPDYTERSKLAIPQNRDALPAPRPADERRVRRPPSAEALTQPPPGFTDKVRGADGKVSGFTDQDDGKKGFFNWF